MGQQQPKKAAQHWEEDTTGMLQMKAVVNVEVVVALLQKRVKTLPRLAMKSVTASGVHGNPVLPRAVPALRQTQERIAHR